MNGQVGIYDVNRSEKTPSAFFFTCRSYEEDVVAWNICCS